MVKITCISMFLKLKRYVLTLERTKDAPNQSILKENQWRGQKHNKYFGVVFDSKLNFESRRRSVNPVTKVRLQEIPSGSVYKNSSKIERNCRLFWDIFSSAIMNDLFMTFTSRLKVDAKCVYQQ